MRRGEAVALDVEDIEITGDGLVVTIWLSKTDQEGKGAGLGLPYGTDPSTCPVRAYQRWLDVSGIPTGAIFRQGGPARPLARRRPGRRRPARRRPDRRPGYGERVKLLAGRIGIDPATVGGPLHPPRLHHQRGPGQSARAGHHAPQPAPLPGRLPRLHRIRRPVRRQRRHGDRPLRLSPPRNLRSQLPTRHTTVGRERRVGGHVERVVRSPVSDSAQEGMAHD